MKPEEFVIKFPHSEHETCYVEMPAGPTGMEYYLYPDLTTRNTIDYMGVFPNGKEARRAIDAYYGRYKKPMPTRFSIHSKNKTNGLNDWLVYVYGNPLIGNGYLYPDGQFYTDLTDKAYFETREACQYAINNYVKKGGASVCDLGKKNPQIVNGVITILGDFHKSKKRYTAHDVTKEVRLRLGSTKKVEHRDIRDIVHELHSQGGHWYVMGYSASPDPSLNAANPPLVYEYTSPIPAGGGNVSAVLPGVVQPQSKWHTTAKFAGIVRQ